MKQSQKIMLLLRAKNRLHHNRSVIASEAKQSPEIASSFRPDGIPRNDNIKKTNANYLMFSVTTLTFISAYILFGIGAVEPMMAYGQSTGKISLFQESGRNPFVLPPGVRLLSEKEPTLGKFENKPIDIPPLPLKIKAILISDHIRLASIDRYIVTVGDLIYDERVLEIKADQVVLGKGDKKRTIFLDQSPIKLTVERQGEK